MNRAILFSFLVTSIGASALLIGCGDDDGSGGAGGATTSTSGSPTTSTSSPTTGTQSTSSNGSSVSTGMMATTAAGMFDCADPDGSMPALTLTDVATGLEDPVLVKSAPDNPDRLYIVEQTGAVLIWENGGVLPTPFIDVGALINAGGEEGLLGLAFAPDYATSGRFFLHYTSNDNNDSTVSEFVRSADPLVAEPDPVQLVIQTDSEESNHNGGSIEFGSDGFLYIAFGDGGGGGDPDCDAQDPDSLLGKMLRLDVNAAPAADGYPAAAGNPNGSKVYHSGLRNPWRVSFDVCSGDLYIGDVGQGEWEEVDVVASGTAHNFGWPIREGAHDFAGYNGACESEPANPTEPVAEYNHNEGCSITGGYVYRSMAIPGLRGFYFYSDICSGTVWMLRWDGTSVVSPPTDTGLNPGGVSSFGQDGHGNVYVVSYGSGVVSRIDAE